MASTVYKLSATLKGHEDDVRAVAFTSANSVVSVSRDATVRLWKLGRTAEEYDDHINSTGSAYVNTVRYIPASPKHPNGLIVTGGSETVIEVRELGTVKTDPDYLLLGHAHNVCALDSFGEIIVSGSWDGTARIWRNWETEHVLRGHEGTVWTVLALSETEILTGGADKTIRLWRDGKQVSIFNGHTDCVRGLCKLPNGLFASCANDETIRIWSLGGNELQQLHGHTSYIYSISALPSGEIFSSSEDRTVRVWKDGECIQTITHPAISVWGVAACPETGDIVSGASDRIVRVFSRDQNKWANKEVLKAFEDSVAKSNIPSNQVGEIQKDKLPGLEALQNFGKKDGQVIMVRNGDIVEAHVWSASAQEWSNVGQVVDAPGSVSKRVFEGKEYDFVFDVDIQEGAPPLKLPYNASENPFDAARRFLENNELPISYLDTVGNFIVQNSQGVSLGQSSEPADTVPDPFGIENRYRPGETNQPLPPPTHSKLLPQKEYLTITAGNLALAEKKIRQVNDELLQNGQEVHSLNPEEVKSLGSLCTFLQPNVSSSTSMQPLPESCLEILSKLVRDWPPQDRLPALDLLRLVAGTSPLVAKMNLVELFSSSGTFSKEHPNNVMLAVRAFVNIFQTDEGKKYVLDYFNEILNLVSRAAVGTNNRNLKVAMATLTVNFSILFRASNAPEKAMKLLESTIHTIKTEKDSEATFRALVALGNMLTMGNEIKDVANSVYDATSAIHIASGRLRDPRIHRLVAEIQSLI